jgi:hypothetical protein
MYSHLHLGGQRPSISYAKQFHCLLVAGNWSMIMGVMLALVSILLSYPLAHWLSLPLQVLAHISTLVFATLVKFGYIMRVVALNRFAGISTSFQDNRQENC